MTAVESLTCPTCGAPLSISGSETEVKCQFCGNMVRVASARTPLPAPAPNIIVQPRIVVSQSRPSPSPYLYGRRGSGLYRLVILLVVVAIIGGGVTIVMQYGGNPVAFLNALAGNGASVVNSFGGKGTGPGLWDNARDLTVDGKGYVYVDDRNTGRIQRFDAHGQYVSYWDVSRTSSNGPECLTADRTGNVYACQDGQLLKYDGVTGKLLGRYAGPSGITTAATMLDNGVLAGDGDTVMKFDATGNISSNYNKLISAQMSDTFGVVGAVDGLGNMFFLNPFTNVVLLYSADGKFINRFGSHGRGQGQFDLPESIAVDSQSRIYIGDRGQIKVFDSTGRYLTEYTVPGMIYTTYSLAFGPDGSLYALCMDNADNEEAKAFKLQLPNQNSGKS